MARTIQPPTAAEAEQRAAKALEQLNDDAFQAAFLANLVQRVESCEQEYGLRSEDVGKAIDAGELVETHEVCQWLLDYKSLVRLGAR
ncbi:MAG: hypothetical protein M3Z20_20545 [Chloroflexota bacterium]|nr:hypothetical protein [Chloroflexota bacterium]